MHYYYVI